MSVLTSSKINHLLSESPPGGLLFAGWLRKEGYSSQLLKKYRDSGWFESLARGVMYRRHDKLSALTAVYCYNPAREPIWIVFKDLAESAHFAMMYINFVGMQS